MKKKTVVLIYSAIPLLAGLLIILLGFAFGGIESFIQHEGSETFILLIKILGVVMGVAGAGGVVWTLRLSENPELPGYAGLNGFGFTLLIFPLFFLGPFWLLLAWSLWLTPFLRA